MVRIYGLLLIVIGLFMGASVYGQGSWEPIGANMQYPRTLMGAGEVDSVRNSLGEEPLRSLYEGVYQDALGAIPSGNSSASDRRVRARLSKHAAFVLLMKKGVSGGSIVGLSAADSTILMDKALDLLNSVSFNVPGVLNYTDWQWYSKALIDHLIAYDLLKGAGVADSLLAQAEVRLQNYAGDFLLEGTTPFFFLTFFTGIKNNHNLMTSAALGMAAVVLNELESADTMKQPQRWIDVAMVNLDNVMFRDLGAMSNASGTAGYYEGPYYFHYALLNMAPFFRAMHHFLPDGNETYEFGGISQTIRHPWYDDRYAEVYHWMRNLALPNGLLPPLEDSFVDVACMPLWLLGNSDNVPVLSLGGLPTNQRNTLEEQLVSTVDLRTNFIAAYPFMSEGTGADTNFYFVPEAGNMVMRSSLDSNALYYHVGGKYGSALINSSGHNQADDGSFMLYSHGQPLALDGGYLSYDMRDTVGNAWNHNLVLVDGIGPLVGVPGNANGAEVFLEHGFALGSIMGGEARTAYASANLLRSSLMIRGRYVLVADYMEALGLHTYGFQLHGNGLEAMGSFAPNLGEGGGTWSPDGTAHLLGAIGGYGGNVHYEVDSAKHEMGYNQVGYHSRLLVELAAMDAGCFAGLLFPHSLGNPPTYDLSINGNYVGIQVEEGGYTDFVFHRVDTSLLTVVGDSSGLSRDFETDAKLVFVSEDAAGDLAELYWGGGKLFRYGANDLEVLSSQRANVALRPDGSGGYVGYVSDSAVITVGTEAVSMLGEGYFSVGNGVSLGVVLWRFEARVVGEGVRLGWEGEAERYVVERSHDGEVFSRIGETEGHSFVDEEPLVGEGWYRLGLVDVDGSVMYGGVRQVFVAGRDWQVWVGEVDRGIRIEGMAGFGGESWVELVDMGGRVVWKEGIGLVEGWNAFEVVANGLGAGLYGVRIGGIGFVGKVLLE